MAAGAESFCLAVRKQVQRAFPSSPLPPPPWLSRVARLTTPPSPFGRRRAFTLLELVAVVLILALLAVLLIPVAEKVRARLDATKCAANLRSLQVAASLHVQEKGSWPQVTFGASPQRFAEDWIAALRPYGPDIRAWTCPTVQRNLGGPDLGDPQNVRIDYVGTSFDDKPQTPFQYASQPWFAEVADAHGNGNLLIFANGRVLPLGEFRSAAPGR